MRKLTLVEIEKRIGDIDPEPLIRGAVPPTDMARRDTLRESIEAERGEAYTDFQWSDAERNLLDFFGVLAEW